jgi:polyisoprenoid-binding protein YceI
LFADSIVAATKELNMSIIAETSATPIPAGTWSIDPVWSSLEFEVKKAGLIPIKGRVPGFTGTIRGGDDPTIEGTVDATSITTFDETRDGHLQSPDFFDTERYPQLRFSSTEVRIDEGELRVQGELTIKTATRRVGLTGTLLSSVPDLGGNERIGVELEGTIDRTEYDLLWNAPLPGGGFLLPNDVTLRATFAAVRAA